MHGSYDNHIGVKDFIKGKKIFYARELHVYLTLGTFLFPLLQTVEK